MMDWTPKARVILPKIGYHIIVYLLLTGLSFIIVYPLFVRMMVSVMSVSDLSNSTVRYFARAFTMDNYTTAMRNMEYFQNLIGTFLYTLLVSLAQVISGLFIAYGFARFNFKGKNLLFGFVLLTLIVPQQIYAIPLYFQFKFFNLFGLLGKTGVSLIGNPLSIALLALTGLGLRSGLIIFMLRQFFTQLPKELEESAAIDGANPFRTFFSIALPSSTPMIVTSFLFCFVWQWTDTFYSSTFLPNNTFLQKQITILERMLSTMQANSGGSIDYVQVSLQNNAGILLYIIPLLLVFLFGQRYFIESIERTGIVG